MLITIIKVNSFNYTTDCISVYVSPSSIYLHTYCTLGTGLMARNVQMNNAVSAQPVLCDRWVNRWPYLLGGTRLGRAHGNNMQVPGFLENSVQIPSYQLLIASPLGGH